MPIRDQIAAVARSRILVGQHGAGLVHCFWMPIGAIVQILTSVTILTSGHTPMYHREEDVFSTTCGDVIGHRVENFVVNHSGYVEYAGELRYTLDITVPISRFMAWF